MNQNVQESGISAKKLSIIALAIALNVVGGQIALLLHLPVYLDSIGTILIAVIYGPFYGILPPLLYGMVMGFTLDIYSLYFMPVGIILGLTTGIVSRALNLRGRLIVPGALIITIPGTITSALITALLFGGITSSGSTVIVQILNKAGMGLTASVFVVQILTDYLDRLISLALVAALLRAIPARL
ncbi:MAG: ECF transporter S component, partial [Sarcina sp.]|nr:ECF transporter S component [Sarcina sp.]